MTLPRRTATRPRRRSAVVLVLSLALILAVLAFLIPKIVERLLPPPVASCVAGPPTAVRGLIGSEKKPFFDDPRVRARFVCAGLEVTVDPSGSREMLAAIDRGGFGFAFPSSTPTAEKIMRDKSITERFAPFSTPMVVATFRPIVEVLTRAGIVHPGTDGTPVVDVEKLLQAARNGTRWDQLPGNVEYKFPKAVLLSTTDPQDSNSAIMYLSIASYVANGSAVVATEEQARHVLPDLCRLIVGQGIKPETSQVLFDYYLQVGGMGRTPMALVYEAQVATAVPAPQQFMTGDRVELYPAPTVYSRHTLVPLDDAGGRVGHALVDDPELARLAAEHGFRPERPTDLPISNRPTPGFVVEPPEFEILESMLSALATATKSSKPCADM